MDYLERSITNRHMGSCSDDESAKNKKNDKMYDTVMDALRHCLSESKVIHEQLNDSQEANVDVSVVMTPQELEGIIAEYPDTWQRIQQEAYLASRQLLQEDEFVKQQHNLPRSDISSSYTRDAPPTRRYVLTVGGNRKKKKAKATNGIGTESSNGSGNMRQQKEQNNDMRKYCPWGDQLLPKELDESSGEMRPKLPAVCFAPIMPPEIAAIIRNHQARVN